jgi:redox-sensing transcriptional repressor
MPSSKRTPPSPNADRSAVDREPTGVSPLTVNRLSVYLRSLRQLEEHGLRKVSSQQLEHRFHLSSTQIRKDLANFGEFGVRGVGYDVAELADDLATLLGLDSVHPVVLVGMGNLGTALARFPAFNSGPFRVVAGFDTDAAKIGRRVGSIVVEDWRNLARVAEETHAEIAVLAVPADGAAAAAAAIARAGIAAILNFAPVSLPSLPNCRIKNVDLRIQLEELSFFLRRRRESSPR